MALAHVERLNFVLPDFTRISWVNDAARTVWEPRFQRITNAWLDIEWLSVKEGVRPCGVTILTPEALIEHSGNLAKHGLNVLPVEMQGGSGDTYSSTGKPLQPGEPFMYRIVVGTPESNTEFKQVWDNGDNPGIGRMLGFPSCCIDFFEKTWVEQRLIDTTWSMATNSVEIEESCHTIEVSGPPEANILWRWMGVRTVPHLPCKFDCKATVEMANKLIQVGRDAGFKEEMDWLLEILSWPVEWSAIHGIAEIKTPILKVSACTDATPTKYTVQYKGEGYPDEGVKGLGFPFKTPARPLLTTSTQFKKGLVASIGKTDERPDWYASDNGFSTIAAMERAHNPIIQVTKALLAGQSAKVLDLGCGNGALLKSLRSHNNKIIPYGVELNAGSIDHASQLLSDYKENFLVGNIFESDEIWDKTEKFDLVILMPGRLIEANKKQATEFLKKLQSHSENILLYAYGDWLTKYQSLNGLADKAGFSLLSAGDSNTASLAKCKF